jgi:type IV pilus assembly protein PilW
MASVILVAVVSLFTTMGRSYTTQNVAADVQQETRAGIELMIQEIRMAGFNPTGSAGAGVVATFDKDGGFNEKHDGKIAPTDAQNLAFTLDFDMDGRIDHCIDQDDEGACDKTEKELIAYRIHDGALEKYRSEREEPFWEDLTEDNVSDLSFTYYDEAGVETTDVNAIRTVEISMTTRQRAGRAGFVDRTYKTRVRCRNIGL